MSAGDKSAAKVQAEGNVLDYGEMREQRIFLIDHSAVSARAIDGFVENVRVAAGVGKLRRESGDDAQDGGFAAARRADDADEFAFVGQILDDETHVLDRDFFFLTLAEGFRDVAKRDHLGELRRRGAFRLGRGGRGIGRSVGHDYDLYLYGKSSLPPSRQS